MTKKAAPVRWEVQVTPRLWGRLAGATDEKKYENLSQIFSDLKLSHSVGENKKLLHFVEKTDAERLVQWLRGLDAYTPNPKTVEVRHEETHYEYGHINPVNDADRKQWPAEPGKRKRRELFTGDQLGIKRKLKPRRD